MLVDGALACGERTWSALEVVMKDVREAWDR